MPRLADAPKRYVINKAGLVSIYGRLFGELDAAQIKTFTVKELHHAIKTYGRCQCFEKRCKTPFKGYCEYDHNNPNAIAFEGEAIFWRALTKECHDKKTNKGEGQKLGDKTQAAKIKNIAIGNTQFDKRAAAGGTRISSHVNGLQTRPMGSTKRAPYQDNSKQLDPEWEAAQ